MFSGQHLSNEAKAEYLSKCTKLSYQGAISELNEHRLLTKYLKKGF
jgi:hypothetical protein